MNNLNFEDDTNTKKTKMTKKKENLDDLKK